MKFTKYILFVFCCIAGTSCDDYLERFPLDNPSDETFLRTEAELDLAVTGVYNMLWFGGAGDVNGPFFHMLDAATDIGWERNTSSLQNLGMGIANADNSTISSYWSGFYRGIARCNYILSKAEPLAAIVPEAKYNRVLAEVRFFRAYYYSLINELYGGVPLLTRPVLLGEAQLPRNTRDEVTDFILAELDAAMPSLLAETGTTNKGRVNKGAALALKSRVALYNKRWEVAAQAASELMKLGTYALHNNFGQLFQYGGKDSKEIIFSVQYMKGTKVHSLPRFFFSRIALGHSNKIPVQALVDSYACTDGLPIDKSPLFDPKKPFANRDPRLTQTVVLPQTRFINYMFETHPDSLMTWDYSTTPARRVQNVEATHAYATFSGYLWRKYADATDFPEIDNSELPLILFRYAEVLLNYAEAKIELNQIDASVYEAINAVRQRATVNMPPVAAGKTQAELRSVIRFERKSEFAGEGLRLFDIRRWNIGEDVMKGPLRGRIRNAFLSNAPRIDENATPHYENVTNASQMRVIETRAYSNERDNLWPIPRLEREVNPTLTQNPNY
ncbi:RagB/SusD family nutrient uptake outer membrane protein [Dyadobacter aurulentus]|uniref:RagB/SusD family nutrient uptake outer membrane protein n=1 Tax=Dyadobacter sp. UC 10 TaxID=2605428 RepID=UPI0011F22764|nr:RagB/SusD family nutrient uptake outer membrane protein [Dyadobacter sp. UC 10]KAA0992827.1 RagB/SusD family nutrient uptake outer membrane protein [Dyadobacter sp. UC 10]